LAQISLIEVQVEAVWSNSHLRADNIF